MDGCDGLTAAAAPVPVATLEFLVTEKFIWSCSRLNLARSDAENPGPLLAL
jgi:hypothetical protein